MFIDTHAHLNLDQFASDYKKVIERAFAADVKSIINIGVDYSSSKRAVQIAKEYENIYAAVGYHPTDLKMGEYNEKKLSDLFYSKKVVAIGEIGLDYFHDKVDKDYQKELFIKQIDLANKFDKPVIVHCRDAYSDLIEILGAKEKLPRGVMHCWVGNLADAKILYKMGFYFSFTGIITFAKSEELSEIVKFLPIERIMIETDCPWLAPEPYRGKQNEPAYVVEVAKKIAEIKGLTLAEVEEQTTQNAIDFFKLDIK